MAYWQGSGQARHIGCSVVAGNIFPAVWGIVRRRELFGMGWFVEHVVSPQFLT
jgi:hypothetical protein